MSKKSVSSVGVPLFGSPVPYSIKPFKKTLVVDVSRDSEGSVIKSLVCSEDSSSSISSIDFRDVTLSNLIAHGVEPRSLDLVEVSKLGIDRDVDSIANKIISNSSLFVKPSNE